MIAKLEERYSIKKKSVEFEQLSSYYSTMVNDAHAPFVPERWDELILLLDTFENMNNLKTIYPIFPDCDVVSRGLEMLQIARTFENDSSICIPMKIVDSCIQNV